jgi:hypothetical protein
MDVLELLWGRTALRPGVRISELEAQNALHGSLASHQICER